MTGPFHPSAHLAGPDKPSAFKRAQSLGRSNLVSVRSAFRGPGASVSRTPFPCQHMPPPLQSPPQPPDRTAKSPPARALLQSCGKGTAMLAGRGGEEDGRFWNGPVRKPTYCMYFRYLVKGSGKFLPSRRFWSYLKTSTTLHFSEHHKLAHRPEVSAVGKDPG